uniref:Uncharacterized protein n=1 Tax=Nelumbo nucifera TaxID=4432 RepID=A0A822Z1V5_NELNU|nr:TPA_asm: hypothetical protein HUJ06_009134 [Nelumbo nucifera]
MASEAFVDPARPSFVQESQNYLKFLPISIAYEVFVDPSRSSFAQDS